MEGDSERAVRILRELLQYSAEREWFEFKEKWFEPVALGQYVSALSNAAAMAGREEAYFVWGVNDKTHSLTGSDFDQYQEYKGEPYQNYLNRNLAPKIKLEFIEGVMDGRRFVILVIGAASDVPVGFAGQRYGRVGSSKVCLKDNPKLERRLFKILDRGYPTILNVKSDYDDLAFGKLFMYYGSKGIELRRETFKKNLCLLTEEGSYNMLAQLLSDNSHLPLRLSIFEGETKGSNLYAVKEFGYDCILYSLKNLLDYGDILNIIESNEAGRKEERSERALFDIKAYNEAIVNAVLHNKWAEGNEPMVSVFSDRIEILSRGTLAPSQTMEGFYLGESIPVNEKLSEIFAQLRISDKSGRGVPKIVEAYSRQAFDFRENSIVVTIPFRRIFKAGARTTADGSVAASPKEQGLSANRQKIISEMRHNPNVTKAELSIILGLSVTSIDKNILFLKKMGLIERVGSNKTGFWKVNP